MLLAVCCKTVVAGDDFVLWDFVFEETVWHSCFGITVCKQTAFACVSRKLRLCSHLFSVLHLRFVFCFAVGLIGW